MNKRAGLHLIDIDALKLSRNSSQIKSSLKRKPNASWQSDTVHVDSDDASLLPAVRSMNCSGTRCVISVLLWSGTGCSFKNLGLLLVKKNSFARIKTFRRLEYLFSCIKKKHSNKAAKTTSFFITVVLKSLTLLKKCAGKSLCNISPWKRTDVFCGFAVTFDTHHKAPLCNTDRGEGMHRMLGMHSN